MSGIAAVLSFFLLLTFLFFYILTAEEFFWVQAEAQLVCFALLAILERLAW